MTDWITQLKLKELEQQHGLPGGLLGAVMQQESGGNPNAVSPKGAQGLFQFMPETAQAYGIDPYDPQQAAIGAARMYGDLSKQYGGDLNKMLAGYNWGSGNIQRQGMENMPEETRNYIANITQALQSQGNMNPALPQGVQVADAGTTMSDAPNPMTGQPTEAEIDAEIQALEAELGIVPTQASAPAEDEAAIDAEIAKLEAELGLAGDAAPAQEPDFLTRVGQSLSERGRQGKEILDAASRGEQTDFESMLQLIGKPIAGTINDAIGGGLNLAGKGLSAITPDFIEDPLMAKLSSLAGTGAEAASPAIERLTKAYGDFAKDSPRAARNIEAIANIGMVAPVAKPLSVGAKAAAEATGQAAKAAGQAVKGAVVPNISKETAELAKRAEDFGIPLRLDQIGDSRVRDTIQKVSQEVPFSGQSAFENTQREAWNKALARSLGVEADRLTPEVINQAFVPQNTAKFNSVLRDRTFKIDNDFKNDLTKILAKKTPDEEYVLKQDIADVRAAFNKGQIDGNELSRIRSSLLQRSASSQGGVKSGLSELIDSIDSVISRNVTDVEKETLDQARREYRNFKVVEGLLGKSGDGEINPTDLIAKANANKFINLSKKETGSDELVDLARIGKEFLAKKGGSDTTQKAYLSGALGTGSVAGAFANLPATAATLGANRAFQQFYNSSQPMIRAAIQKGLRKKSALERMSEYGRKVEKAKE